MVLLTALISFVGALASTASTTSSRATSRCTTSRHGDVRGLHRARPVPPLRLLGGDAPADVLLIGIWGGPRREYAAISSSSTRRPARVFHAARVHLVLPERRPHLPGRRPRPPSASSRSRSFAVAWAAQGLTILGVAAVKVVWIWLFVGFAIKIPMFPFHTWLPDAHVRGADRRLSVILAGVLLKMGTYGILRINFTLLPEAHAVGRAEPWRCCRWSTSSMAPSAPWRRAT